MKKFSNFFEKKNFFYRSLQKEYENFRLPFFVENSNPGEFARNNRQLLEPQRIAIKNNS